MPLRFVILHHTGFGEPHYDLMFETHPGSDLMTFRCPVWPVTTPTVIEKLSVHRRAYLDYEGPVSGNRGEVRRVEVGELMIDDETVKLNRTAAQTLFISREADTWRIAPL